MLVSLPLFMAVSLFSFLFRHISSTSKPHNFHLFCHLARHLSLSASSQPPRSSSSSSISDRLSFVFDQIDQIEKERAEKDEALQRIKAWRESKKIVRGTTVQDSADATGALEGPHKVEEKSLVGFVGNSEQREGHSSLTPDKMKIELVHPWPEWIEFMERLVQQNYFDQRRKDEDTMIEGLGLGDISDVAMVEEHVSDFTRDWKAVQTAVLNFGRDRFDVFRSLSRQDIQLLVGYGCPSSDRKVVFSAKLLRKHVHLDEGDVCSTCSLRSSCEKAYLLTNKEDEARTIDVVRVLLTYGFDPIDGSVSNKSLLKHKSVKTVVRKLLHEVVKLSSVPIDPNLPPPVIKKRPPKVKQPPPPPKRRVGRDDVEMKKGDWLCPKCDFLNFAKNVVCLQCDAKRPKRQLLPGEWECPQCNFLNYRRNMACFHCEHKRPSDDFLENKMPNLHHEPKTRMERAVNRQEVSNAWNFDFDDDESDGADVATFEHADAPKSGEGLQSHPLAERGNFRGPDDDVYPPRDGSLSNRETREYSGRSQRDHSLGFDDFDEEDDDVNDYELENTSRARGEDSSSVPLSDIEGDVYSSSEDEDDSVLCGQHSARMNSRSHKKQANPRPGTSRALDLENDKFAFGSDDDLPAHPKWKSSHVADIRQRGSSGASSSHALRRPSFTNDKDDEFVHGSRSNTGNRQCDFRRGSDFKPRMNRRDAPSHGEHYGGRERGSGGRQDRRRMTGNWNPDLSDVEKPKGVRVNVR